MSSDLILQLSDTWFHRKEIFQCLKLLVIKRKQGKQNNTVNKVSIITKKCNENDLRIISFRDLALLIPSNASIQTYHLTTNKLRGSSLLPSLRKQPTVHDATTSFPKKWCLRNKRRNYILLPRQNLDLGTASDWLKICFNQSETLEKLETCTWKILLMKVFINKFLMWNWTGSLYHHFDIYLKWNSENGECWKVFVKLPMIFYSNAAKLFIKLSTLIIFIKAAFFNQHRSGK